MQNQISPLPSLTPLAQFRVDRGQRRTQCFACLPDSRGDVQLNVVKRPCFRSAVPGCQGSAALGRPGSVLLWAVPCLIGRRPAAGAHTRGNSLRTVSSAPHTSVSFALPVEANESHESSEDVT